MFVEVLTVSGVLFWLVAAFVTFLVAGWLGKDNQDGAVIIAAIAFILAFCFTDAFRGAGIFWLAILIPLYALIGVGWALYKWRSYVLEKKQAAAAIWDNKSPTSYPDVTRDKFMQGERPTAIDNKERLTGWMALWPWSMSFVVLRFPWRFIVWTYEQVSTVFERASQKLWGS